MLQTTLFVLSFTIILLFLLSAVFDGNVPLPILHKIGVSANHTYLYTPAIAYQVWFWFNSFNVI